MIWEAICYLTKTGSQWRYLPGNYAPWDTVYWYFRKWTLEGIIEVAHQQLRKALRKKNGKKESASLGIIDSHSVRMSSISGQQRGIDGNKKIKGSKRHLIVDTMGLIIYVVAHAANIHDSKGGKKCLIVHFKYLKFIKSYLLIDSDLYFLRSLQNSFRSFHTTNLQLLRI